MSNKWTRRGDGQGRRRICSKPTLFCNFVCHPARFLSCDTVQYALADDLNALLKQTVATVLKQGFAYSFDRSVSHILVARTVNHLTAFLDLTMLVEGSSGAIRLVSPAVSRNLPASALDDSICITESTDTNLCISVAIVVITRSPSLMV
jgi:hypothetical protein